MGAVQVSSESCKRVFVLLAALVTAGALGAGAGAGAAYAQSTSCSAGVGQLAAQVQVDSPAPNETVSGRVSVKGTARVSALGLLNRVDVSLGSASNSQTFDGGSVLNFNISVDTSSLPSGAANLTVAACGGLLLYGEKSFNVTVAAAPVTTNPRATTTTAGPGPGPTTAGPPSTTATTVAGAPVVVGATTSTKVSTTTTTAVETTEPPAPVTTTATTVRPPGRDTPLVLTETPPKRSSGPPVWVGAVVGISGGLGLLFSARPWRRRGGQPGAGEALEDETRQLVP